MLSAPFVSFKIVTNIICYVREAVNGGTNNRQSCHEQEMVSTHWFPTLSREFKSAIWHSSVILPL